MDIDSTPTLPPPKTRLHELKNSADFASEEFNHSIKTWVNMASLLVKQGSMAESSKDDENAYISYVRACLIVTKIIPAQAHYKSMMNDIVCIDMRQKILGTVSRMGHLERRLLRRFEQESHQQEQHRLLLHFRQQQQQQQQSCPTEAQETPRSEEDQQHRVEHLLDNDKNNNGIEDDDYEKEQGSPDHDPSIPSPFASSTLQPRQPRLSMLIVDGAIAKVEQRIFEQEQLQQLQRQQQEEDLRRQSMENDLALTFDHHSYVSHHHSRYRYSGSRSSPLAFEHVDTSSDLDDSTADQPTSDYDPQEDAEDEETVVEELPKVVLRTKKKTPSDGYMDGPILKSTGYDQCDEPAGISTTNSDEDAALGKVLPSALFAHHREGMHVRRCSSTDAISRTNSMIVYPSAASFPDIAAAAIKGSLSDARYAHSSLNLPVIPPRSEKRSSVMTGIFGGSSGLQRNVSISGPISLGISSTGRSGIERDVLQNRFGPGIQQGGNRRTMSFESGRQGNHYQHQLQLQLMREQQKAQTEIRQGQQRPGLEHSQSEQDLQQQPPVSQRSVFHNHPTNPGSGVAGRKGDLPPAPRPSIDKISLSSSSSSGTSSSTQSGLAQMPSSQLPTPVSSPLMTSNFQMNKGVGHGSSAATLHAHSPSLASITSSTSTNATMVDSPSLTTSSSPTMISSWTTTGKRAGLLRKIRSKSAMKDELFDIVVVSPPQTPSLPGHSQQQQQQQALNRPQTRMATMA
ncbi:hypothetical protein EMPS_02996 [Entomortierella parvispora]|uniref:USP8 dimerisation domain-containing protein n=1 Tax=Entomortierella parvispora TaxID=205924 RepID=A0A9P3LU05_9FUNG|nr:hypothetical protein EMPS_02996 [Entomortierella parvispora]